jgi:hypothetical protein
MRLWYENPKCEVNLFPKMPAPIKVLTSLENSAGDRCLDIFVRDDGTFGFEEYRKDPEDQRGWFSLHLYSYQVFATAEDALARAKSRVEWMIV